MIVSWTSFGILIRAVGCEGRSRTTLFCPLIPLFSRIFVATRGW